MGGTNTTTDFRGRVLLVEDDGLLRRALARDLRGNGVEVTAVGTLGEATDQISGTEFDAVVVDAGLPDGDPLEGFRAAVSVPLLVITGDAAGAAPRASKLGLPVLEKPFSVDDLRKAIATATRARREPTPPSFESLERFRERFAPEIVGQSDAILRALTLVQRVAPTRCSVVLRGETGTGKEWLAQSIHRASNRTGKFVAVNCAAIPEAMVESELFGHVRGAFTGALNARDGHLVASSGGTLFLDEMGELPLPVQAKLLRALQEREVTPVGSSNAVKVDLRVIAATHRDLREMVDGGRFRSDLLYRLDVVSIRLAPLRSRAEDIPLLAERFRELANERLGTSIGGLTPAAMDLLKRLPWQGNVRELQNVIERAAVFRQYGLIDAHDVMPMTDTPPRRRTPHVSPVPVVIPPAPPPAQFEVPQVNARSWVQLPVLPAEGLNLRAYVEEMERSLIEQALRRSGNNRNKAATLLGLKRTTLVERLRKLGIQGGDTGEGPK